MSEFSSSTQARTRESLSEAFATLTERTPAGCLEWRGAKTAGGYGLVCAGYNSRGRNVTRLAHRVWYELNVGPIPEGLQLDHLCRNRPCVEPTHLEPVTARENLLRGENFAAKHAVKTHCPRGHAYTDDNTKVARGRRICKACRQLLDAQRNRSSRVRSKIPAAGSKP